MPFLRTFGWACLLACLGWACSPEKSTNTQQDQKTALPTQAQNQDCQNCGMPSQDYPQWHAKIELTGKDKTLWFCSPRCMFSRYHKLEAGKANRIWVKDYYTTQFIEAPKAFFVVQSAMLGPMGADLVPLADQKSAESFQKEHQGKKILPFEQITPAELRKALQ